MILTWSQDWKNTVIWIDKAVLNLGWFCSSRGYWQCLETLLIVTGRGRRILLFSGWRLGRLLNMLLCLATKFLRVFLYAGMENTIFLVSPIQCIGPFPTTKNDLVQIISSAQVKYSWHRPCSLFYFPCTTIILLIPLINHCSSQTMVFLCPLPPS